MSRSCLTCSSDIPLSTLSSSLSQPSWSSSSSSSKPSIDRGRPYLTPCCSTPICSTCLSRNPRLREYTPCLRCGDVRSAEGSSKVRIGAVQQARREQEREQAQFAIGDSDDDVDDDDKDTASEVLRTRTPGTNDLPPEYSEESAVHTEHSEESPMNEDEKEVVEVKHLIARSDTLLSIARKYATDPHHLLTLNNLPPSTLHSHPHLLRTRRELVVSRQMVPKSSLPAIRPVIMDDASPVDPVEAARRKKERAIKRFQLMTKTVDPAFGRVYIDLEAEDGEIDIGEEGTERGARLRDPSGEKKGAGGIEERALDRFWDDEDWEKEVGGPQRGIVNPNGGSSLLGRFGIKAGQTEGKGKWKVVSGARMPALETLKV